MSETDFTPPTAQQMTDHLHRCAPIHSGRWWSAAPLVALGAVVALTFVANNALTAMLPLLVMGLLMFGLGWRVKKIRRIEQRTLRVQELALMRYNPQALRLAWRLLPDVRTMHELHGRTVASMAHCLDQVQAYESAIVGYDFLVRRIAAEHPSAVQLAIHRAIAQLLCDHLTDADDALRKTRGAAEQYPDTPIAAAYRYAALVQQVQTNHFADAVAASDDLVVQLRPLGVEAGYGYALMALSHHMTGADGAAAWWSRATTLLPPATLTERFSQLRAIEHLAPVVQPPAVDPS